MTLPPADNFIGVPAFPELPLRLLSAGLPINMPTDLSTWAMIAAVLATAYVYMKAKKNIKKDPLSGPLPYSSLSAQRRVEHQMTELLIELEKMARQMNAQLDTRAAKLEELITQADHRIETLAQLEARLESRPQESRPFDSRQAENRHHDNRQSESRLPEHRPLGTRSLDGRTLDGRALDAQPLRLSDLSASPSSSDPGQTRSESTFDDADSDEFSPAPIPIDPRHVAVYRLSDQGRTSSDIAREIGQPAGEVELILALRRRAAR